MTWWSVPQLHTIMQKAGFTGGDAKVATAVALLASGGADHHHWEQVGSTKGSGVGLFDLDPADYLHWDLNTLSGPVLNATLARERYADEGTSWTWHWVWRLSEGRAVRTMVAHLDSRNGWKGGLAVGGAVPRPVESIARSGAVMRDVVGQG